MQNTSTQTNAAREAGRSFVIDRHDAFSRLVGVLDQMGDIWPDAADCRRNVGRFACLVRDTMSPLSAIADMAREIQATFTPNGKAWAILGCVQNILLGGKRQSLN